MHINIEFIGRFIVINLCTFDWVRGLRIFFGTRRKRFDYFKSGAQHIEYYSKEHKRSGCVHYIEFCLCSFFFKVELILPKYYKIYLGYKQSEAI
jgi:hypothetical protein